MGGWLAPAGRAGSDDVPADSEGDSDDCRAGGATEAVAPCMDAGPPDVQPVVTAAATATARATEPSGRATTASEHDGGEDGSLPEAYGFVGTTRWDVVVVDVERDDRRDVA